MDSWRLPRLVTQRYAFTCPTKDDIAHIAANLRESDRAEGFAQMGRDRPLDALKFSLAGSADAVVAIAAWGEPVALIGVATVSVLYGVGCPWMVATDRVESYRRAFIQCGRIYTCAMLEQYSRLTNHVDARNTRSIAWLRHLGYRIHPAAPYGALGLPFHPFDIER